MSAQRLLDLFSFVSSVQLLISISNVALGMFALFVKNFLLKKTGTMKVHGFIYCMGKCMGL